MAKTIIGIMGPGEGATAKDILVAFELGKLIATEDWVLLTGGRNVGVMDAANKGAKEAGGLTIGILPTSGPYGISEAVDIPILTGMQNARNNINALTCEVIVACGMGLGTASEITLALKANTNVILLNTDDTSNTFFKKLGGNNVLIADDPVNVILKIKELINGDADK
jgi:uncharacterized protein (TIGR00725 family)